MPPRTGGAPNWGEERTVVGLVLQDLSFFPPQSVSDLEWHQSSLGFSHSLPWTLFFLSTLESNHTPWHTRSLVWELPRSLLHLQGIIRERWSHQPGSCSGLWLDRYLMRTLTSPFWALPRRSPRAVVSTWAVRPRERVQHTVHQSPDEPTGGRTVGHVDPKVTAPEMGFWFFMWNGNLWVRSDSFIK